MLDGVGALHFDEADFKRLRKIAAGMEPVLVEPGKYLFRVTADIFVDVRALGVVPEADIEYLQTLVSYAGSGLAVRPGPESPLPQVNERQILYQSPRMQSIMESVQLVGPTDATVLIVGESGTGKESIARAIHDASARADKPFTIVDCGAIVGSLIESELFGHVKGAFTGADRDFTGRLVEADGGTVLLDEIGELPLDVQVKLLRFVQEQQIMPVGGNQFETVDTRIIAATNRDLTGLIETGEFREDLYYRLNVFSIETPPLRERDGDLLLLARHFLERFARQYGKQITGFSREAETSLREQTWPGNIRELMNVINRAVILCRGEQISNIHLGLFPSNESRAQPDRPDDVLDRWAEDWVSRALDRGDLPPLAQWFEEDLIEVVMIRHKDVLNRAAQTLGLPESTLRRKVARMRDEARVSDRPPSADTVEPVITELLALKRRDVSILDALSELLIRVVESRQLGRRDAAAIMGISLPTYRKMLSDSP